LDTYSVTPDSIAAGASPSLYSMNPNSVDTARSRAASDTALVPERVAVEARRPDPIVQSVDVRSTERVKKEVTPAAPDSDTATRQTVEKMCEYIRDGAVDEGVRDWARRAIRSFSRGQVSRGAGCWSVFWLVKHAVRFARDEPMLFRVGEPAALDLLIAPAVLVRMRGPREDCDGFTMLICAMLRALGIDSYVVTVAADPADPERWSHVFPVAVLDDGSTCALDASHGAFPGWMVPAEHIYRWQAWSLDGRPANVAIPAAQSGLHGYVPRGAVMQRRRGMGQDTSEFGDLTATLSPPDTGSSFSDLWSTITQDVPFLGGTPVGGSSAGGSLAAGAAPSSAPGTNWTSVLNSLIGGATKLTQEALLPQGGYIQTSPSGAQTFSTGGIPSVLSGAGGSSLLPILGIGLVAILVLSMASKK
jgi:hypothetical protein